MKMMKLALLGTAALAAVSVSARADDLSDLKAQIEALKADVAALQSAPSVPAGYSLMTISDAATIVVPTLEDGKFEYGATANNIGVLPTADMPASTNIQWSGFVRAAIVYTDLDVTITNSAAVVAGTDAFVPANLGDDLHLLARGEIKVVGTTDTAVGEVGALVKLRANFDDEDGNGVTMPEAWGWWKMTPELTFGGGYTGSLATINHGVDNMTAMYGGGVADGPYGFGDNTQFRVSYASGPISAAVSVGHRDDDETHGNNVAAAALVADGDNEFGFEGELKYSGDAFSIEVAGGAYEDNWLAGVGVTASMDMFSVQVGAQLASSEDYMWMAGAAPANGANNGTGTANLRTDGQVDAWVVSALITAALSDSLSAELGGSIGGYDGNSGPGNAGAVLYDGETMGVAAGLYYTPVSQLTLGVEASWNSMEESEAVGAPSSIESETVGAAFVSVFRF